MMLGHLFAHRYTAILTSYGFFLLKKPPEEPLAELDQPELHKYLLDSARKPSNDALLYASLNAHTKEKRWGRIIDCWGDVNLFGKWIIVVTANRGTFVISTPDAPLETLEKLNRDVIYHLTGE